MTGQYIVQGIFALAGIVSLLASLLNWDWFFTTRNAQTIVRNVGRNRARLFYGILGIIIIGMAVFFFVETRKAIGGYYVFKRILLFSSHFLLFLYERRIEK